MRSKFSCLRSSCDLCACTHAHSLEGTLITISSIHRSGHFSVSFMAVTSGPTGKSQILADNQSHDARTTGVSQISGVIWS